jgi:hypothetical protein
MKRLSSHFATSLVLLGLTFLACSKDKGDDVSGDGDQASGGTTTGSGGSSGTSLDRDALAENCAGKEVEDGESCDQSELVCTSASGSLCICGGVPPETGQVQGTPTGEGGRRGSGGNWSAEPTSTGGTSDASSGSTTDRVWECFSIGPLGPGGETGSGGDESGSGGESLGGQGGAND